MGKNLMSENSLHLSWYGKLSPAEREAHFEAFALRSKRASWNERFTDHWHDPKKLLTVQKDPQFPEVRRYYWWPAPTEGRFNRVGYIFFDMRGIGRASLHIGREGESCRERHILNQTDLTLLFDHTDRLRGFQFDAWLEAAENGLFYNVYYLRNRIIHFSVMNREDPEKGLVHLLDSGPRNNDIDDVLWSGEIPVGTLKGIYEAVTDENTNLVSVQKRGINPPECLMAFLLSIDKDNTAELLAPGERFADPFETDPVKDMSWMGADLKAKFGVQVLGLDNYKEIKLEDL